jgi:hypothetical protein
MVKSIMHDIERVNMRMEKGRKCAIKEIDKAIEELEQFLEDTPEDLEVDCM